MNQILIKNARIINEGKIITSDIFIENEIIQEVSSSISLKSSSVQIIDAENNFVMPGIIDDQVHFREPGLTHKATIKSESKAAVAGGITSFIEMPNTSPQATTVIELEKKFNIASKDSHANYSFMFGGTNDNLDEVLKIDSKNVAALKLFLGSSTGNMLVDDLDVLEKIFSKTDMLIAVHCEDESTIKNNLKKYTDKYGDDIPMKFHPLIRSREACYISSSNAIKLAKKTGARLHVFHLSTAKETELFTNEIPLEEKLITAEVCIHHLWFDESDYDKKGTLIKWNPAVKTPKDRAQIWEGLLLNKIDVIATDHAPHTKAEKNQTYAHAPSGGPLIQHSLVAMLEFYHQGKISLEQIAEKMSHAVAVCYKVQQRGFIREGYFADLALVDLNLPWRVAPDNILAKCGWSPFEGSLFRSQVEKTFVSGHLAYDAGQFDEKIKGKRLSFNP